MWPNYGQLWSGLKLESLRSKDHFFDGINDENKRSIQDQWRVQKMSRLTDGIQKRRAFFQPAGQSGHGFGC